MNILLPRSYLVEEKFPSLLLSQVHSFNGELAACTVIHCNAHDPSGALANLDKVFQRVPWISRRHHHLQRCPELLVGEALLLLLLLGRLLLGRLVAVYDVAIVCWRGRSCFNRRWGRRRLWFGRRGNLWWRLGRIFLWGRRRGMLGMNMLLQTFVWFGEDLWRHLVVHVPRR